MGGKVFRSAPVDSACKQRKYRVVIIDAGAEVAQVLAIAPNRKGGHQVQTATNGRSGVELVRSMEPDVVISSIEVPGLDG